MIFDDIFYPGNPRRRQEVANLKGEVIAIFKNYKIAWNNNAMLLNDIFAHVQNPVFAGMTIMTLEKNIESDTVGDCIDEINKVILNTKDKLNKLVDDIGLSKFLPADWKEKGCSLDQITKENIQKIGKALSGVISTTAAGFVGYYVFSGVCVISGLITVITNTAINLSAILGGALLSAILGGAVFIITDLIASAITGAIERKELNEAIDSLKKLKEKIEPTLSSATGALCGITQSIKDGLYRLDDKNILYKMPNGDYTILTLPSNSNVQPLSIASEGILFLSA